jgi:hypothetical protein
MAKNPKVFPVAVTQGTVGGLVTVEFPKWRQGPRATAAFFVGKGTFKASRVALSIVSYIEYHRYRRPSSAWCSVVGYTMIIPFDF